jgi:hypothetical protein
MIIMTCRGVVRFDRIRTHPPQPHAMHCSSMLPFSGAHLSGLQQVCDVICHCVILESFPSSQSRWHHACTTRHCHWLPSLSGSPPSLTFSFCPHRRPCLCGDGLPLDGATLTLATPVHAQPWQSLMDLLSSPQWCGQTDRLMWAVQRCTDGLGRWRPPATRAGRTAPRMHVGRARVGSRATHCAHGEIVGSFVPAGIPTTG